MILILLGQTRFCKNRVYCHKNNVGYNTADKVGQQFVGLGGCFVSVGAENTFKLGDITLTRIHGDCPRLSAVAG